MDADTYAKADTRGSALALPDAENEKVLHNKVQGHLFIASGEEGF